jgi:hypothetical protein
MDLSLCHRLHALFQKGRIHDLNLKIPQLITVSLRFFEISGYIDYEQGFQVQAGLSC